MTARRFFLLLLIILFDTDGVIVVWRPTHPGALLFYKSAFLVLDKMELEMTFTQSIFPIHHHSSLRFTRTRDKNASLQTRSVKTALKEDSRLGRKVTFFLLRRRFFFDDALDDDHAT